MDYSAMPIEELVLELHHETLSLKDPSISHRLREIATYNNGAVCIPLLSRLCGEDPLNIEDIMLLLENGADPNVCCTVLSAAGEIVIGETNLTTRPLNNFIWSHCIRTKEEREVLCALLDYGMDPNLCSSDYGLNGKYRWFEGLQERFEQIQEFCNKYLAEQEELSCKEPGN